MLINGLADHDGDYSFIGKMIEGIINGVSARLFTDKAPVHAILESRSGSDTWSGIGCPPCYLTGGGGIFLRGLLYNFRKSKNVLNNRAIDMVQTLANVAVTHAITPPTPQQNWLFSLMDRLVVLNMGICYGG